MEQLLIFPFNGNGIEAIDCIQGQYELIGFVDDTPEKQGFSSVGYEVFGREAFKRFPNAKVLAVPGGPNTFMNRIEIIKGLNLEKGRFACVIHPKASVSNLAAVGTNVLLMAGVIVTSNATIKDHVCILPHSVIHHDSSIGEWTLIGSHVVIAGNVCVGNNCYVGSGSSIINGVEVGDQSMIGLGSAVIRSVPTNGKVAGNPAKELIKQKTTGR
jgi:sugar O-acyltransferase (sialic acid O-acetyltransferase NeuD family)